MTPQTGNAVAKKRGPQKGCKPSGGIPKGYRYPATLAKIEAREFTRKYITARLPEILDAQIHAAIGIKHFMVRDPETGQFTRLTDVREIEAAMNHPGAGEGSTYWIFTKDPSTQASKDMLDRALDRPKEQEQTIVLRDEAEQIATLRAGRLRSAARGRKS